MQRLLLPSLSLLLSLSFTTTTTKASSSSLRGSPAATLQRELADAWTWYDVSAVKPQDQLAANGNVNGTREFRMTIWQDAEYCHLQSKDTYSSGRFEVRMQSAATMPGVITALYLASGEGRTGDAAPGNQDELDFEFKGLTPQRIQTNVFLDGQEAIQMVDIDFDSSKDKHDYAMEWNTTMAVFSIDGKPVRVSPLPRALKPLRLHMSVWTTSGGWPGLIKWGGDTRWDRRNYQAITASFDVLSLPQQ